MLNLMAASDPLSEELTARERERERNYPVLVTIDLLLHWALCLGILAFASSLVWVIIVNTSSPLPQQFFHFVRVVRGH